MHPAQVLVLLRLDHVDKLVNAQFGPGAEHRGVVRIPRLPKEPAVFGAALARRQSHVVAVRKREQHGLLLRSAVAHVVGPVQTRKVRA